MSLVVEWRDVVGFEDYFMVSSEGEVWSKRTERLLKKHIGKQGYETISTRIGGRNGKTVCFKVHRLVAEAFLGEPCSRLLVLAESYANQAVPVNHKDGIKHNNSASNLEWCSAKENKEHAAAMGLTSRLCGVDCPASKLKQEDIEYIRENYKPRCKEMGINPLSKKFDVNRKTIRNIISNKSYKP